MSRGDGTLLGQRDLARKTLLKGKRHIRQSDLMDRHGHYSLALHSHPLERPPSLQLRLIMVLLEVLLMVLIHVLCQIPKELCIEHAVRTVVHFIAVHPQLVAPEHLPEDKPLVALVAMVDFIAQVDLLDVG